MVGNSANENMSEDLDVDEIQYEVTLEDEFQAPLAVPDGLRSNGSWEENSSTPVKLNKFEGEDEANSISRRFSEEKKRSSTEVQTENTIKNDLSCVTESQWNTAHSPLLFTPVKGENTYGAGYLSRNSSNYSANRVGSASKIPNALFTTPPPKSVKKLSLISSPTTYQPDENNIKIAGCVKINGCVSHFLQPTSVSRCEEERNISPKLLVTTHEFSHSYSEPAGISDRATASTSACGINSSQNSEAMSCVESDIGNRFIGRECISPKPVKSSPPNSSPIPEAKEERLRQSASFVDKKYSHVPSSKARRKQRLRTLLSRLRRTLNGLPPPPSVTIPQLTVTEMLEEIYKSDLSILGRSSCSISPDKNGIHVKDNVTSLFHPSATDQEIMNMPWPDVLDCVHLGVCYNLGCSSETLEDLCQQVREKYVGNETASSCSIWSLPKLSEDSNHRKTVASLPSNIAREGYITRRRRAFSIASLSKAAPSVISKSRQILVNGLVKKPNEGKKYESKGKRECTLKGEIKKEDVKHSFPKKSFGEKGGSAKKKNSIRRSLSFDEFSGNHGQSSSKLLSSSQQTVSPLLPSTKRVLSFGSGSITKNKMDESSSLSLPSCSETSKDSQECKRSQPVCSTSNCVKELSEVHKKKLLWAVAQALRSRGLGTEHSKFKICAIPLFRQCREEFLNASCSRRESAGSSDGSDYLCPSVGSSDSKKESTSDKMLAIALSLVDRIMREVGVAPVIKERVK